MRFHSGPRASFLHSDPQKGGAGTAPVNPILVGDNQWHYIVATWGDADGNAKLYIDGALVSQGAYTPPSWSFTTIYLGKMANSSRIYSGLLDEVRICNHALSEQEVLDAMTGASRSVSSVPNPADGAIDVVRDVVLGWKAGPYAKTHDVYFGTGFNDVNNASRANPMGVLVSQGQDANTYDPAGLLTFGQTYYWRVDEVNAPPDSTIYKGDIWSFTAETYGYPVKPIKATASSSMTATMGPDKTIDGSGLDAADQHSISASQMWLSKKGQSPIWIQYEFDKVYKLYQMWVWNSNQAVEPDVGFGAKDVTIETSLDGTTWTALADVPEFAQATGEPNYVHNTTVDFGGVQAKYVKLTINSNWADGTKQAGLSEVRFFYVPVKAFGPPRPRSHGCGHRLGPELATGPGGGQARGVPRHRSECPAPGQTVTDHRCALGSLGLEYGRTYYWRIDEVNDAATPTSWACGPAREFRFAPPP